MPLLRLLRARLVALGGITWGRGRPAGRPVTASQVDSTAFEPPVEFTSKESYANTKLGEPIGRGSYGRVFSAECDGVVVAVKVMPINKAEENKTEIEIMRRCECKFIVSYRDAFTCEYELRPTLWIVMDKCIGSMLDVMRWQDHTPFSEAHCKWAVDGVTRALVYLHIELMIIHRDIKVAN